MHMDPGDSTRPALIRMLGVAKAYRTAEGEVESLKPLEFDIREGEFLSIVGPSGCGKSTLLKLVGGLLPATGGSIEIAGKRVDGLEARQHLLLEHGHRQDEVGSREVITVAAEVGRDEVVLAELDALVAERQTRVERGDHAVTGVVRDPSRPNTNGAVGAVPRQHPLQQQLGHDAPSGVGVAHHQDCFHGSSYRDFQKRRPPPRSRHSSAGATCSD